MKIDGLFRNFTRLTAAIFFFILCGGLGFHLPLLALQEQKGQDQEHEPIVEEVTVTNVEVPVRVLYKGKPVDNLTAEDFSLYENKKKMNINGFFIKRRKINITPPTAGVKTAETGIAPSPLPLPPRTFVLAFNISTYNSYFQAAMDHLFDTILRPTDHVIVFANNTTREYRQLQDKNQIKQQIIADLKKESQKVRQRLMGYINQLETNLKVYEFRRFIEQTSREGERSEDPVKRAARKLVTFLQRFLQAWNEYKKNYLTPRVDSFYYFARYLEKVKAEKFVLNFYQFEFFPKIRLNSQTMHKIRELSNLLSNTNDGVLVAQGHMINNLLNQLQSEYDLNKGFPNEEISKLFYKVDATFHSFFIKAANPADLNEFEYQTVASDLERVLKSITDITGGKNITSNNLVQSLDTVSNLEDVYYILTYVPQNPKIAGKLKIKVKNRKYDVLYDNNFRADYINEYLQKLETKVATPDIKITDFSFDRKILAFTVTDYLMGKLKETDKNPAGVLNVRIRLLDSNSNTSLFDQQKMLTAQKKEMKISLGVFKNIPRGQYNFFIDAKDMITGKEANFHQNVKVR